MASVTSNTPLPSPPFTLSHTQKVPVIQGDHAPWSPHFNISRRFLIGLLTISSYFLAQVNKHTKTKKSTKIQASGGSGCAASTDHNRQGHAMSQQFDPLNPLSGSKSPQQQQWRDGGRPYWRSLLLSRRNNRLRIFLFIFFRESERREAAWIEKKTFHSEFYNQAWPALLKEPLRCGFKRNSLCGTEAGREPWTEEKLQCV